MRELGLIDGYRIDISSELPEMSFRKMFGLALKTWPYMRPMLRHLLALLAFGASGLLIALVTGFVGTDLITNKVLLGEKLQPVQALVLFVDDSYVTTNPERLGQGKGKGKGAKTGSNDSPAVAAEPELTLEQRRTVRDRLLLWTVLGGALGAILVSAAYYYTTWIWQSINQNLRVAMVNRAENLSLKYHDNARVGDAIFRVYQDSAMIINLLQGGIITPLMTLYGVVVGIVIIAAFDPWFALMVIVVAMPVGWLMVVSTSRIRRRALANRIANSNLTSRIQEVFAAVKLVKANRAESLVHDRFHQDSTTALNAAYFLRLDMALLTTVVAMLGGTMLVLSEYVMVAWVIDRRETFLGAMVASLIGFVVWNYGALQNARLRIVGFVRGGRGLLGQWMRMQDLFIALDRAFYLLELEPDVKDPDDPIAFPTPIYRVNWRGVGFGYDAAVRVLKDVTLEARVGTVTAIVGATGAGKSTLMSMLLRMYDADVGEVEVNGVDLRSMKVDDIRANTAIALQKNVLFADSIANNIKMGTAAADRAAIVAAAKVACADEFIIDLPKGYDTELGERGSKLSAGQRQRLSIARAIVRDAPILILDEPTASLDAHTEQRVLANLSAWGADRVIFLITHRLSTIRHADQIALLEDGQIVELGHHDDLIGKRQGRYRAFVEAELTGAGTEHE